MVLPPDLEVLPEGSVKIPGLPFPGSSLAQASCWGPWPFHLPLICSSLLVALKCLRPGNRWSVPLGIALGPWSPLGP